MYLHISDVSRSHLIIIPHWLVEISATGNLLPQKPQCKKMVSVFRVGRDTIRRWGSKTRRIRANVRNDVIILDIIRNCRLLYISEDMNVIMLHSKREIL